MENSFAVQRFVNILYDIYLKTYNDRKIAEYHYESTERILQLSNDLDDRFITNGSGSKNGEVIECNCKSKTKDQTSTEIENLFVQDIETALNKAKIVRTNDKKTISPYLKQNVNTQKSNIPQSLSKTKSTVRSMTSMTLNSMPKNKTLNKLTNYQNSSTRECTNISGNLQQKSQVSLNRNSKNLITLKTKSLTSSRSSKYQSVEHLPNCPKNKSNGTKTDLSSKSRVSLGYPASLESIRIPSEIQRALKLYFNFVNENNTIPINRRSKTRSLFLEKLDEMNSRNWDLCQKEDFKSMFELKVYINKYEPLEESIPSTALCRFYEHENQLFEFQESINKYEKIMLFKEIFTFINNDFIHFVFSPECSETLLPLVYKCIIGIINVYNYGKFQNIAVVRAIQNI